MNDIWKATEITPEIKAAVVDQFEYHKWDEDKIAKGALIRHILQEASLVIIANCPPCADRSTALRKLREARMDCNSAITHDGKY